MPKTSSSKLRLSPEGIAALEALSEAKGWNAQDPRWCQAAEGISASTLKRVRYGKGGTSLHSIRLVCRAVGMSDAEIDRYLITTPNEPPHSDPSGDDSDDRWVGRKEIWQSLCRKLEDGTRSIAIAGMTGIGKTALAERLLQHYQDCFESAIYIKLEAQDPNALSFLSIASHIFAQHNPILPAERRNDSEFLSDFVAFLRDRKFLLLFDALEVVLAGNPKEGWNDFRDPQWVEFFARWFALPTSATQIVMTTQDLPGQLMAIADRTPDAWSCFALNGFTPAERNEFWRKSDLEIPDDLARSYLDRIGNAFEGHPLALTPIACEIAEMPFFGNIAAYWSRCGRDIEEIEAVQQAGDRYGPHDRANLAYSTQRLRKALRYQIERVFRRLYGDFPDAYILLCYGAVFRHATEEELWIGLLVERGYDEEDARLALDVLHDRYLVEAAPDGNATCIKLRLHNLIRSVALKHLRSMPPPT